MKKTFTFFIAFACLLCTKGFSQDFTFSQFYEKPLLRNPALAGVFDGDIRVSVAHRNQWGSVTVPFQTSAVSIENKLPFGGSDDFLTLAVQMTTDAAGDIRLKRTQLLPTVNYHKSLSSDRDSYLSLAFMGGISNSQFDPTQMKLADQWQNGGYSAGNATMQKIERTGYTYLDASTGLTFSSSFNEDSRYYVGAALYHFNKPKVAFNNLNSNIFLKERWVINAGLNMRLNEYRRFIAFADFITQGGGRQLLMGAMYGINLLQSYESEVDNVTVYFGSFLRMSDAIVPMVKLDMKNLSLGLSYDVNISKLHVASSLRGGVELTASYKGFLRTSNSSLDKVRCVRF